MQVYCPFRTDNAQRARLWNYCSDYWKELGFEPVALDHDGTEEFNRAKARNQAGKNNWTVAVFADADIAPENSGQVHRAMTRAVASGKLVFAHNWRAGLSQEATESVLQRQVGLSYVPRSEWDKNTFSGCYAISRDLWDLIKGFDERFQGWGFEDLAFMHACETLGGVERVDGVIFHLWHERNRKLQEEGLHYPANEALWIRYRAARANPRMMTALIEERGLVG